MLNPTRPARSLLFAMFALSFDVVLYELLLTRLFSVVLFAQFAQLALGLALLGIAGGAMVQHLKPRWVDDASLERRLSWLLLGGAVATFVAIVATVSLPVTVQFETPPLVYQERAAIREDLLDLRWFAVLLPILTVPFVLAGWGFAATFQHRRQQIGALYAADLIGGAAGALAFLPVLGWLAGPDTAFVILTMGGVASWILASGGTRLCAGALVLVGVAGTTLGLTGSELIRVRYAAGYSEENVTYTEWTPLTRLALHEDRRGVFVLLDNSSASEVVLTERQLANNKDAPVRSLVYALHAPPARVAILAASAGPEVAVAQSFGHTKIHAIDIAGSIYDIVRSRYADSTIHPYAVGETVWVQSDGRAAILHAKEPYDVIQMVHANLWSAAGLLSNAWSPALLENVEAFETYLDKLSPDGTISFGRGSQTDAIVRSAAEALRRRGVADPHTHLFYLKKGHTVLLVKPRPFTQDERDRLMAALPAALHSGLVIDPLAPLSDDAKKVLRGGWMTDDRPYLDDPSDIVRTLRQEQAEDDQSPLGSLYRALAVQSVFTFVAGCIAIGLPFWLRRKTELGDLHGVGPVLLYACGLGYAYLAIETVLVHELVLFVGHPTYAITVVILAMLLSSGAGSALADRLPADRVAPVLRLALGFAVALGALQTWVIPPLLHATLLGSPIALRIAVTFVVLLPLGFVMGMPFPLAVRSLRPEAGVLVPWCWALNGWMSVVGSLGTVVLSRVAGYSAAFAVALLFYVLAWALAPRLSRAGSVSPAG